MADVERDERRGVREVKSAVEKKCFGLVGEVRISGVVAVDGSLVGWVFSGEDPVVDEGRRDAM